MSKAAREPNSYVEGVTAEEFAEFKLELEEITQRLAKEKKEKEELTEMYDELKNKYVEEAEAKEEAVSRLRNLKAEALRLVKEKTGRFEEEIVKSKSTILALKDVVDSMTQELKELRMEEEMSMREE